MWLKGSVPGPLLFILDDRNPVSKTLIVAYFNLSNTKYALIFINVETILIISGLP